MPPFDYVDYIVIGLIALCAVIVFTRFAPRVLHYVAVIALFLCACLSILLLMFPAALLSSLVLAAAAFQGVARRGT